MLIGERYSDNKLYRGIKHYNKLPLPVEDIHEYADLISVKNSLFMNSLIGSGTLNEPSCTISAEGIRLDNPSIVLIDGDISLVQADNVIVTTEEVESAGYYEGLLCIVGWYQSITASSTIKSYGGIKNTTLENDLIDPRWDVQVSTRYQFRWDTVLLSSEVYESGSQLQFSIQNRDALGELVSGSTVINLPRSNETVRSVSKPNTFSYSESDLYILPILKYSYDGTNITNAKAYRAVKPLGASNTIISEVEPTGEDYYEGTLWYQPSSQRFKFYINGVGFISAASDLALMQYNNTVTISETLNPSNITVPIGINSYSEEDILQVIYEGVVLTEGQHYSINYFNRSITLTNFTAKKDDHITFLVMRLTNAGTASSIAKDFNAHVITYGNSTNKGHVALSDSMNNSLGVENNVAATPKAVYNSTILTDTATNKKYRLRVTNGSLGLVEV